MGIWRSKIKTDKELEKSKKKVTFNIQNNEISMENIDKFIDELLKDESLNIKYIPDKGEREIYRNMFLLLFKLLDIYGS